MYSTHSRRESVVAERFIRTLNNKIYKYITSLLQNVYIDKFADIVNKYNNRSHNTVKMKPADVSSSMYIGVSKENNIYVDKYLCWILMLSKKVLVVEKSIKKDVYDELVK